MAVDWERSRSLHGSGKNSCDDYELQLWDLKANKLLHKQNAHSDDIHAVSVNWRGSRALSASCDKAIKQWRISNDKLEYVNTLSGHSAAVNFVVASWEVGSNRDREA
eukprot:TRINITY_DN22740_c0_g1_i1.p2 TRINITY_DN22740_c0_g1~~TRINITY_DN22740_c0_g1_i1.p2  ORF type:complete len:107 (+),score=13.50 TRINITY_DN22740_c0_g1_i1:331-651(+)